MYWPAVVRSRKLEFSTPSAMPLNEVDFADVVKRQKSAERIVRDFGVDSHVPSVKQPHQIRAMAVPLNGVYKARQSLLHRSRRPSGRRLRQRIPRPSAIRADQDGLSAAWIPRYRRAEEIISVVTPPGRL